MRSVDGDGGLLESSDPLEYRSQLVGHFLERTSSFPFDLTHDAIFDLVERIAGGRRLIEASALCTEFRKAHPARRPLQIKFAKQA